MAGKNKNMTEYEFKEKRSEAVNELLKYTNYIDMQELDSIYGILNNCKQRYGDSIRKGTIGQLRMVE